MDIRERNNIVFPFVVKFVALLITFAFRRLSLHQKVDLQIKFKFLVSLFCKNQRSSCAKINLPLRGPSTQTHAMQGGPTGDVTCKKSKTSRTRKSSHNSADAYNAKTLLGLQ